MTVCEKGLDGIELYGANTGNCLRVSIALEEALLPYRVHLLDLRNGEHRTARHLALNPAGQVPVIIDRARGKSAFILSQSNAILFYVAERAPGRLLPIGDSVARARTFERFFFFLTDVIAPSHAGFALRPTAATESIVFLEQRSLNALERAERCLEGSRFVAGDEFSLADIAAVTITLAQRRRLDWDRLPQLRRWYGEVMARPSVERGLRAFREPQAA